MKRQKKQYDYSSDAIKQSILRHARSIKMSPGWAEQIADKVVKKTDAWIADKELVTENDLRQKIIKEIEPLSADLAYAYKNHDKII